MGRQVLLIDDSKAVRTVLRLALEREGYEVREAGDGELAIDHLDGRPLDAIVCDLNMPNMDGVAFLRVLRNDPRYKRVPVLVLTTDSRPHMKAAIRTGGAQAYLKKPCHPGVFTNAVNALCN